MSLIRGRRYNRLKKSHGGHIPGSAKNSDFPKGRTNERLAREHGVSADQIQKDGKYASAVETLTKTVGKKEVEKVITGEVKMPKSTVVAIAQQPIRLAQTRWSRLVNFFSGGALTEPERPSKVC